MTTDVKKVQRREKNLQIKISKQINKRRKEVWGTQRRIKEKKQERMY
jgi:hypothetical protein